MRTYINHFKHHHRNNNHQRHRHHPHFHHYTQHEYRNIYKQANEMDKKYIQCIRFFFFDVCLFCLHCCTGQKIKMMFKQNRNFFCSLFCFCLFTFAFMIVVLLGLLRECNKSYSHKFRNFYFQILQRYENRQRKDIQIHSNYILNVFFLLSNEQWKRCVLILVCVCLYHFHYFAGRPGLYWRTELRV